MGPKERDPPCECPARVGSKYIEIEGRQCDLLEFFGVGGPGRMGDIDLGAKRRAIRPLGQWNTIEIAATNGQVHTTLNGVPVSSIKKHDYKDAGYIAFQSQGAKMYWRNIRVKVE